MIDTIIALEGPQYQGTKPKPNKLHDDKTSYTGVYKNGGPKNVDSEKDRTVDLGFGLEANQENMKQN